jgi:hypothetical protein
MTMRMDRPLASLVCAIAFCVSVHAQSGNTVSVKLLDGRTGQIVVPSNYLVRVNHHDVVHNEWLKINDDGSALVTLPADAADLSVQATYDTGMEIYTNCDAAKEKAKDTLHWYAISDIMKSGTVAPDECGKTRVKAKPGEFVFFVRKHF